MGKNTAKRGGAFEKKDTHSRVKCFKTSNGVGISCGCFVFQNVLPFVEDIF
jgi:hypothetical protein